VTQVLSTTSLELVRRTCDVWTRAGVPAETQAYARWEYNGDGEHVLREIVRAGRRKPANSRTSRRGSIRAWFASLGRKSPRREGAEAVR